MRLSQRDKAIIRDINRFRVMDRDSIAKLHFGGLKRPINSANSVLKRLVTNGHIRRSTKFGTPFLYLSKETSLREDSAKIGHYLAILNVYKDILRHGTADVFQVEPKYGGKGTVEPDVFCIFRKHGMTGRTPFFIEVQNTFYSQKVITQKLKRYEELYQSRIIAQEPWQPSDRPPVFPIVLIISEHRYAIDGSYPFRVIQAQSFTQFMESLKPAQPKEEQQLKPRTVSQLKYSGGIKIHLGVK
ncbi:replication-relaxation family protein [Parageobacillus sp. VR-IP]|uniref:replication-relaxation family protein n=1 Tax=Parageobacillus sp. VR-IP TaxID=2742205 RepID=UPI001582C428|nr:replication-relaxation family protein [Parageobacillus sp. VR-IP]NUK32073.1 replication-relaxation family protein [Parageobacillus sp. VR-IP]